MKLQKQVSKSHYQFHNYLHRWKWRSLWCQLDQVLGLNPHRVLEIGPGPGVFKSACAAFGVEVETLDVDPELKPDHVGSATSLPFADSTYDVVCAFQVLEHMPYEMSLVALREMVRVSRRKVVVSLPDAMRVWQIYCEVPRLGVIDLRIPKPLAGKTVHEFDGEHYWELNKFGYDLDKVVSDFENVGVVENTFSVPGYSYHRFFVISKFKA